jgi:cytochrome P450
VRVSLLAANRSPEVFRDANGIPNPLAIDLWRDPGQRSLTFGGEERNIHACLGAHLARMVVTTAVEVMLQRWNTIRWNAERPLKWAPGIVNRVEEIWFAYTPA